MSSSKYIKYIKKIESLHKKLLSGTELFSIKSSIDPNVIICAERPINITKPGSLWFGERTNVYQSMYNIHNLEIFYLNYMPVMYTFLNYIKKIDKILMIGLGGGHLPMLLQYHFPNVKIKIIELDKSVIKAANHLGFTESPLINVIVGDGVEYCNVETENDYDACIIDLDDGLTIQKFNFDNVSKLINDDGILAINYYNGTKTEETLSKIIEPYFKSIKTYAANLNYVYMCKKNNDDMLKTPLTIDKINHLFAHHINAKKIVNKLNNRVTI